MSNASITTMAETLQSLNEAPVPILPDEEIILQEERAIMEQEEKYEQAWNLKMRGISVSGIARALNISVRTVGRYLKEAKIIHLEGIEQDTAAQNLAGQIKNLEDYERMCLHEASLLNQDKVIDPNTGAMVSTREGQAAVANKQKFFKLAMDARN